MLNKNLTKERLRLPTFDSGLKETAPNIDDGAATSIAPPIKEGYKFTAADLAYVRRNAQRRLGGGAGFSQVELEATRESRDAAESEPELVELTLPKNQDASLEQIEELLRRIKKKRGGAKKYRSRISDVSTLFRHFSMPGVMKGKVREGIAILLLCFLGCVFFATLGCLIIAYVI